LRDSFSQFVVVNAVLVCRLVWQSSLEKTTTFRIVRG